MLSILRALHQDEKLTVDALIPHRNGDLKEKIESIGVRCFVSKYYTARYSCDTNFLSIFVRYFKTIIKNFLCLYSALKFAKGRERYDLIYTNTSDIYIGFFLSQIMKVKHIWHIREFGVEDQNCRHICSDKFFYKTASNRSFALIVISKSLYNKVSKYADEKKIHIIYNDIMGVDDIYKKEKWENGIGIKEKLRLLIVGQISPGKGQLDVINSVYKLKLQGMDFHLGIVGPDDSKYANFLKQEVIKMQLEKDVEFLGYRKDMDIVRESYDIGVVASSSEAFGRVTIEGMLSGLVMVGSNSGANPELINDHFSGFLYEANNSNDLVRALMYLSKNRADIDVIRYNAYTFAKKFTKGRAGNEIKELLQLDR